MDESRSVPTATSFRTLTVTVLDGRRRQLKEAGRRVSFTHLVAYAIARAATDIPVMAHHYAEIDGTPHRVDDGAVHLGLAVDVEKRDGSRTLMVPVIRDAGRLSFGEFLVAYAELVEKARGNGLTADDLVGANLTLTNPGGLGTVASVPRLMVGQGTIVATGSIAYPVGLGAVAAAIGAEKVMSMTSTYDHRIIQGAESGRFLARIEEYLQGESAFYEDVFGSLGVPLGPPPLTVAPPPPPPVAAPAPAPAPVPADPPAPVVVEHPDEAIMEAVQAAVSLLKAHRTHGHLAARLDPLGSEPEGDPSLDPQTIGLTPALMAQIPARILRMHVPGTTVAEALPHLRETYCGTIAYEIEHIASHRQRVWLREKIESGAFRQPLSAEEQRALLRRLVEVDAMERFMHKAYVGQKQFSIEGLDMTVPMLDEMIQLAAAHGGQEVVIGMAHRGRLNVLAHNLGRPYETIFAEFEGASTLEAVTTIPQGGTGDVKYHHGAQGSYELPSGESIRVNLESNPSHLEFVSPVVAGASRAAQTSRHGPHTHHDTNAAVPIVIHGDAAFPAQGVVAETLNLQGLDGYKVGRDAPPDHQQPGRLHHRPGRRPVDPLGLGPGQGLRRADHPRQRRRRRRLHRRRPPGLRLPPDLRPRRPDRPDRLPPLRPQRGRRAGLHPAGDVRDDQEQEAGRRALGRQARPRRGDHRRRAPAPAPGDLGQPDQPPPGPQAPDRRGPGRRGGRAADRRVQARPDRVARGQDRRLGRAAARARRRAPARPRGLHRPPEAAPPARAAADGHRARTAASTGPTPSRSPSGRCSPRGPRSA